MSVAGMSFCVPPDVHVPLALAFTKEAVVLVASIIWQGDVAVPEQFHDPPVPRMPEVIIPWPGLPVVSATCHAVPAPVRLANVKVSHVEGHGLPPGRVPPVCTAPLVTV